MSERVFRDRRDAGRVLAGLLEHHLGRDDVVVLGLPRGGVPVAYEVATALDAPLDIFVVRKLGVPGHEELALGDVATGFGITSDAIREVAEREGRELARQEQAYRNGRPMPDLSGKTVILVDDGLATGSSMQAAVLALRRLQPIRIVVAVPAAPSSTCEQLRLEVDEVVCATAPSPFFAVGQSYWDFAARGATVDVTQTTDEEVRDLLGAAARAPTGGGQGRPAVRGFCAVAFEAGWPDAYRVNRFVRGRSNDVTAEEALRGFQRFPTWMWRNTDVLDFVGWLRERNCRLGDERRRVGFYGLDLCAGLPKRSSPIWSGPIPKPRYVPRNATPALLSSWPGSGHAQLARNIADDLFRRHRGPDRLPRPCAGK
jgi:predicted phosphoribosyltransferase